MNLRTILQIEERFVASRRPVSVFLTVEYYVSYNYCYMVHSRSDHRRLYLPICSTGFLKLSAFFGQMLPFEHNFASYMVHSIFSSKRHWKAKWPSFVRILALPQ